MIQIEVDTREEVRAIAQQLGNLSDQAPEILRLSINAAARKVRKGIVKEVGDTYTIKPQILKDRKKGAPTVTTAKPGTLGAIIRSKGPYNDLIDFMTRPSNAGVKVKVLQSSALRTLEVDNAKAFITRFSAGNVSEGQTSEGHIAVVQRQPGQTYTMKGAQKRIEKYGYPHRGAWPDLTRIKKLLGPAVPSMMQNEDIQLQARDTLNTVLQEEIEKRIRKTMRNGGVT